MEDNESLQSLREETYQRKLKENIQLKQKFIDIGLSNLSKFSSSHNTNEDDDDELQSLQRETLSLYESLKTVPFKPQRDDLVGISLADLQLEQQLTNMNSSLSNLQKGNEDKLKDIKYIESLIFNLNLLNNLIISKEQAGDTRGNNSAGDIDLDSVIEQLEKRESKLITCVKQIVFKYLVEPQSDDDDLEAKQGQYLKLMEDLLNNVTSNDNKFIEVPSELQNDSTLRQLLVAHVILQRDNLKFIRLNGFGI